MWNRLTPLFLFALVTLCTPSAAMAQEGLFSGNSSSGIEIEADDGIEWLRDLQQYRAYGNATARREAGTVIADVLIAYYREVDGRQVIYRLDAEGNVRLTSDTSNAIGDKAVYHIDQKVAVLVGEDLRLITDQGTITAEESLEYWDERRVAVARGNALITQGERRIKAGIITAFLNPTGEGANRVNRVDALGGVHVSTPTDIVTGQEGVYIVAEEKATICGGVKITRDQNQLNGECAIVNMVTGRSRITSGGESQRVEGLFLPTE